MRVSQAIFDFEHGGAYLGHGTAFTWWRLAWTHNRNTGQVRQHTELSRASTPRDEMSPTRVVAVARDNRRDLKINQDINHSSRKPQNFNVNGYEST